VTVRRTVGLDCLDDFLGSVTSASCHCTSEVGLLSLRNVWSLSLDWLFKFSTAVEFSVSVLSFFEIEHSAFSDTTFHTSFCAFPRPKKGVVSAFSSKGSSAVLSRLAKLPDITSLPFFFFQEAAVRQSVGFD